MHTLEMNTVKQKLRSSFESWTGI